jgi:hypothetical protein
MAQRILALATALAVLASTAMAQTSSRLRGTIAAVNGTTLKISPNGGGPDATVTLSPDAVVVALVPAKLSDITPGTFIGTAAEAQPDGTLVAKEIHVFPESMRGAGEGHRPFDLGPNSTMTNGTVGQKVKATSGGRLTVSYKGGEKTIVVPPDAPVVMITPGSPAMLLAGAHVVLQVKTGPGSTPTVDRVTVGKDGFVPPM